MSGFTILIAMMAATAFVVWLYTSAPGIMLFWRFCRLNRQAARIARTQSQLARVLRQKAVLAKKEAVDRLEKLDWKASKAVADAFEEAKEMHKKAQAADAAALEELHEAKRIAWGLIKKLGRDNVGVVNETFAVYEAWEKSGVQRQNAWQGAEKAWKRVVWRCE